MQPTDDDLRRLALDLGDRLRARGWTCATAESCTGGWIAKCITDVAGSSGWFERGFVTYSNAAKREQLDVPGATLETHGAVSEDTARAMVGGALAHSRADLAVAVTGIAGPDGGSEAKPVGMVWLCWQRRGAEARPRVVTFEGDRDAVRREAVRAALWGLIGLAGDE